MAEPVSRRVLLTTLGVGAVAATGAAFGTWQALGAGDAGSGGSPEEPHTVQVHGGADSNGARAAVLKVWASRPRVAERQLSASYQVEAATSDSQYDNIVNLLREDPHTADLLVVDAEHLPALVDAGWLEPFPNRDRDWLLRDLGCVAKVADRCLRDGELYALPLNIDVPILAFDESRIAEADRTVLRDLGQRQGRDFWKAALGLVSRSSAPPAAKRLLLQTGDYEGFTVCLTELVRAFGPADGPLPTGAELNAWLAEIAREFGRETFELTGAGDEDATLTALQKREAVAARVWPSQCHNLTAGIPGRESTAPTYAFVPIPGGVLGGQVIAVGKQSRVREQAQELAGYLAEAASQVQLNYNGGYVPTLTELYADEKLPKALYGIGASQIDSCVQRPVLPGYVKWSDAFRKQARTVLLG